MKHLPRINGNIPYAIGWLFVAAIVYESLKPEPLAAASGINDKLQHFGAYFVTMAWFGHFRPRFAIRYLHAAFLVALAVVLEFIQPWTGRTFDGLDIIAGLAGIGLDTPLPELHGQEVDPVVFDA